MPLFNRKPIQPTQPTITEEVIRRIVREELLALLKLDAAVEKEIIKTLNDNDYIRKENLLDELKADDGIASWVETMVSNEVEAIDFDVMIDESISNVDFTVNIEHTRR